jgi:TolA-binding protein
MTDQERIVDEVNEAEDEPQNGGVGRLLAWLLRLVLIAALGVALGVGLYLGVPALLRAWMEPVEANSASIEQLELDFERLADQQLDTMNGLADRLAELEGSSTEQHETQFELETRVDSLEQNLATAESQLSQLDRVKAQLGQQDEAVAELQLAVDEVATAQSEPSDELQGLQEQLSRLRVMTLLSRARLELLNGNYGLAADNLEQAREAYDNQLLADDSPALAVIERLDLAIAALPQAPAVAASDMEAAWQLLVEADAAGG